MQTLMSTNWRWTQKILCSDWNKWIQSEAMTISNQFKSRAKTWQTVSMKTTKVQVPYLLSHKPQWGIQETSKVKAKLLWAVKDRGIISILHRTMSKPLITYLQAITKITMISRLQEIMVSMSRVEIVFWVREPITWKSTPAIILTRVKKETRPLLNPWSSVISRCSSLEVSKGRHPRRTHPQRINLENLTDAGQ